MAETLWKLAQRIRMYPNRDHALMIEAWARAKAKEWARDSGGEATDGYLSVDDCVNDLGVPEEVR